MKLHFFALQKFAIYASMKLRSKRLMRNNLVVIKLLFCCLLYAQEASSKDSIQAYFLNDSINGLKLSDAYETHNMGVVYSTDEYYLKIDLGIVSPDMHVYRNQYREANRSFGELISMEIGQAKNNSDELYFYSRIKGTGKFGLDKVQDFAHRLLSLKQVNEVNDLIRMPEDAWAGIGLRKEIEPGLLGLHDSKLYFDGFLGSDTTYLNVKITKEFHGPIFSYDMSASGRFVAYDRVVSASPINAKERGVIPGISFGILYDAGPYSIFVRDTFSLPSIEGDGDVYGVLSVGASYEF